MTLTYWQKKELCNRYDTSNLTLAEVAREFGITAKEAQKILMDDAYGELKP